MRQEPIIEKEKTLEQWQEEFQKNVSQTDFLANFVYGKTEITNKDFFRQITAVKKVKLLCDEILQKLGN